ncbi:MAG: hypothetical protein ACRD5L_08635 [Bryobacteraceae bacterium]
MRLFRTLALSFCPLVAFAQTAGQDWRFAQPGATLVGGVRLEALLQSPILNTVIEQATAKDPSMTAMVGMVRGALSGVSDVRFSVLDTGAGKDPEVLTLVTGRMDDAAATALSKNQLKVYRVDANTLLLGQGDAMADAIKRLSEPPPASQNRAVLRGKSLAGYDLWIAGTLPVMPMTAALGDLLHGLALGLSMQDDLRVELALDTGSPQMAEDLIHKVREAQRENPAAGAATLLTNVDGATARFRLSVEKSVVLQALQEAIANGGISALSAAAPKFKEKEPVSKPITIYGLDEGPREIHPDQAR